MNRDEFEGKIVSALTMLDHENDEHWTGGGLPDIATVASIAGIDSLKRADIEKASPDFKRRDRPVETKGKAKVEIEHEEVPLRVTVIRTKNQIEDGATVELAKPVTGVMMRATARGYYGGDLKEEGDVFSFTGRPGSWMEPA